MQLRHRALPLGGAKSRDGRSVSLGGGCRAPGRAAIVGNVATAGSCRGRPSRVRTPTVGQSIEASSSGDSVP